jgi:glycosyltransferase involved in cell wall biosynthesis
MLLTISIPTYNGARFLEKTLRSAWREVRNIDEVSIMVVENGSTDETPEICQRLKKEGIKFTQITKTRTEPADLNHLDAVELAKSDYVWILADDDILSPGSVLKVCTELLKHRPVVAVINFEACDENEHVIPGVDVIKHSRTNTDRSLTQVWEDGEEAFLSIGLEKIGVLSANCVLRRAFLDEYNGPAHEVPDGFLFIYLVAAAMLTGKTIFLPEPLMLFRQYAKRWEATDLSEPHRIDYLVTPQILKLLGRRGFSGRSMRRLAFARSTTLTWHVAEAKQNKRKLSLPLASQIIIRNWPNMLIPMQLMLWLLPAKVSQFLAKAYKSQLAESARVWIRKLGTK